MSGLRDRNDALFRARFPHAWHQLAALGPPQSRLVVEDGRPVNIDLGEVRLYSDGAPDWTRRQLDDFFRDPDRVRLPAPETLRLSEAARAALPAIDRAAARGGAPLAEAPAADVGFTFVFGIGLGLHLRELLTRTACRNLVLVEPFAEFVLHSLSAVDWGELADLAAQRGAQIHFLLGGEPEGILRGIEGLLIRGQGRTFLDGSYAYVHYPSWPLQQARLLLNERIGNFFVHGSYLEDETLMLRNAGANLRRWDHRRIDGGGAPPAPAPALIVGSGPSLDRDLPLLADLAARALVFTCGSALGILLKNGIRPDFHVENENSRPLVENLRGFGQDFDLSGIVLVASSTVDPEVSALFAERWYYHRAMLSPAAILAPGSTPLIYAGPMVGNAAAAAAAALGFTAVHLFGLDCGRRPGTGHHARDAVYNTAGYNNFIPGESSATLDDEFTRTVPGNFGGEIETSAYKDLSRRTLTELIRRQPGTWINCGDGARIDGAAPKAAAALGLPPLAMDRGAAVDALRRRLPVFAAGRSLDRDDLALQLRACDSYIAEHRDLVARARAAGDGAWDFEGRLRAFRDSRPGAFDGINRIAAGSLDSVLRLAVHRAGRMADPGTRAAFFAEFLGVYAEVSESVLARARDLLEGLAEP
ncbi:MAG: motility associated factor glycosyltransferase family protein [Hyphomicrobiales bacterium]|nr:motility associated factor glycosyltransferase family protein [Hyphomicrobiales bacterium]